MRRRWTAALMMLGLSMAVALWGCSDGEATAPGLVLDVGAEMTVVAGEDVVLIHVTGTNAGGQTLRFRALDAPERATFESTEDRAVFRWDPLISDVGDGSPHRVGFRVTNEEGLRAEKSVSIFVTDGGDGTAFINEESLLFDALEEEALRFEVEVYSREVPQVVLAMEQSPAGATFEQVEDFKGHVEWLPSEAQRLEPRHTFRFSADLGDEVIEQQVTVVIPPSDQVDPDDPDDPDDPANTGPGDDSTCVDTPGEYSTPGSAQLVLEDFAIFEERAICEVSDRDIYAMELLRGDVLDVYMWFEHALGDLDMTLFGPGQSSSIDDGGFGIAQGWSSDDDESIVAEAQESGMHYLVVETSSTPNTYDLMVGRSCQVDDDYAGNHSLEAAASLGTSNSITEQGLKACEGQSDFFELPEGGAEGTHWLGEYAPQEGDGAVHLGVYAGDGSLVDIISGDGEVVDLEAVADPGERMVVEVASDGDVIYDLYFEGF